MDRNNAPKDTKWNLSCLVENEEEYQKLVKRAKELSKKVLTFKGKLNQKEEYKKYIKTSEEFEKTLERVSLYLALNETINNKNVKVLSQIQELSYFVEEFEKELSFVASEEKKFTNAYINELAADKDLASYKMDILDIKEDKKHTLPEEQEKLLSGARTYAAGADVFSALTTSELVFKPITMPNGKQKKVDENLYTIYITDKNANVRRDAALSVMNAYKQHNLSLASNYIAHLKACDYFATSTKFESAFDQHFYSTKINKAVYNNLINSVHHNLPLFYRYAAARKKLLGGKIAITDFANPLYVLPNKKYTYEEGIQIVKDATSVLGADYTKGLQNLTSGGWVDVYPDENKEKGAFQTSDQMGHQFVKLNFVGNFDSVETMAHEFGHAMHSHYSEKTQPYNLRGYGIFVAEIASTVNEILLLEHMKKNAAKKEKLAYTEKLLQMAKSTIFRQTMFSEFEHYAHEQVNKKQPLTYNALNDKYMSLQKEYFGKNVKIYPEFACEWSRIPHFFTPFYVFKYATGMLAAMLIVKRITENPKEFVPKYKEFLSAGSSKRPNDILKIVGIDFEKEDSFNEAFDLYREWVKQYTEGTKC